MSRTRKGSKPPGWDKLDAWETRYEKQKPAPDPGYVPTDDEYNQEQAEQEAWECYYYGPCAKCRED